MKIVVTEEAVREYIREALGSTAGWKSLTDPLPAQVSDVVDPSAAATDPGNPNYVPNTRVELKTTLSTMIDDVPDDAAADFYAAMQDYISDKKSKDEKETEDMKRRDVVGVEEMIRRRIRMIISEALPKFVKPEDSRLVPFSSRDPGEKDYPTEKHVIDYYMNHPDPRLKIKSPVAAKELARQIMAARPSPQPTAADLARREVGAPEKSVEPKGMITSRDVGTSYSGPSSGGSFDVDAATKAALEGLKEFNFEDIKKKPESFLELMVNKLVNAPGDRRSNVEAAIDAVARRSIDAAEALRQALDANPRLIPRKNITMSDVGGASFPDIAMATTGGSHGRLQDLIDWAMKKYKLFFHMKPNDRKILILTVLNEYISYYEEVNNEFKADEDDLTADDLAMLRKEPQIASGLDSFRIYLDEYLRARKDLIPEDLFKFDVNNFTSQVRDISSAFERALNREKEYKERAAEVMAASSKKEKKSKTGKR